MLWDYTPDPYDLHGFIGLFTSLGWGLASLLLVHVIHPHAQIAYKRIVSK
jgi:uncharacterized membrane protein